MRRHSSSSCGQKPMTPWQTEGNEKRWAQSMALYFICRETWLILQLCGHCLLNANNMAAECRAGKKRGLHAVAVAAKLRTSPAEDLGVVARWRTYGWVSACYLADDVTNSSYDLFLFIAKFKNVTCSWSPRSSVCSNEQAGQHFLLL